MFSSSLETSLAQNLLDSEVTVEVGLAHEFSDVSRRRVRYLVGEVTGEVLEVSVDGHEVGLAVDLDERTCSTVVVHVAGDGTFVGGAAGLLRKSCETLGAKQVDGLLHVAFGLRERLLAVHHACAGALAQLLDHLGVDLHVSGTFLDVARCSGRAPAVSTRQGSPQRARRRSPRRPALRQRALRPEGSR